ncbi:uncharacterized protein LOC129595834 [Paramacrobiotus metropolitanus]|uniref:uncharacterized protein LOC129595834 n=1 Tax=Paramacrobiotus metropolitanus TaxID=2943436 RepID=UPI002445780A|nr:uncharacterized protein LOC129595834 [Paramacrobiotus metropolitanus]
MPPIRKPVSVLLCLDYGSAYIKAAVQFPSGELQPLTFNGQNALPTYLFFSPDQDEIFVGHNAKELSNATTRNIVFSPALFLRDNVTATLNSTDLNDDNEWLDFAMPFSLRADTRGGCSMKIGAEGRGYYDTAEHSCQMDLDESGAWTDAIELNRLFLRGLRETCQEQIDEQYNITACCIAVQQMEFISNALNQAMLRSGFSQYKLVDRDTAQINGLLRQFPHLGDRGYIVILRMGANFSTVCIYSTNYQRSTLEATRTEHFGGNIIDLILMRFCLKRFAELYRLNGVVNFAVDDLHRLRLNCEAVKTQLSTTRAVTLKVNQFYKGCDLVVDLTSEVFRDLIGSYCYTTLKTLVKEVEEFFQGRARNYELVMLGGTSKIPLVQEIVTWTLQKPNQQARSVMAIVVLHGMVDHRRDKVQPSALASISDAPFPKEAIASRVKIENKCYGSAQPTTASADISPPSVSRPTTRSVTAMMADRLENAHGSPADCTPLAPLTTTAETSHAHTLTIRRNRVTCNTTATHAVPLRSRVSRDNLPNVSNSVATPSVETTNSASTLAAPGSATTENIRVPRSSSVNRPLPKEGSESPQVTSGKPRTASLTRAPTTTKPSTDPRIHTEWNQQDHRTVVPIDWVPKARVAPTTALTNNNSISAEEKRVSNSEVRANLAIDSIRNKERDSIAQNPPRSDGSLSTTHPGNKPECVASSYFHASATETASHANVPSAKRGAVYCPDIDDEVYRAPPIPVRRDSLR